MLVAGPVSNKRVTEQLPLRWALLALLSSFALFTNSCILDLGMLTSEPIATGGNNGNGGQGPGGIGGTGGTISDGGGGSGGTAGGGGSAPLCPAGAQCGFCACADGGAGGSDCPPKQLAEVSNPGNTPWMLSAAVDSLYYVNTNGHKIMQLSPDMVEPSTLHTTDGVQVIGANSTQLLWQAPSSGFHRCLLPDCSADQIVAPGATSVYQIVVDATHVYWIEGPGVNPGRVRRCPLDLSAMCTPEDVATGQVDPAGLALDDEYIYWINRGTGNNGKLNRASKTNIGTVDTLASGLESPQAIAIGPEYIYWSEGYSTGSLHRCAPTGTTCAPEVFLDSNQNAVNTAKSIAVDQHYVYWTNDGADTVMQCPRLSCFTGLHEIASGQQSPHNLISTEHCIYWFDHLGSHKIMTSAKNAP